MPQSVPIAIVTKLNERVEHHDSENEHKITFVVGA